MGYSTDFEGTLSFSRSLTEAETAYINKFANTRRMRRHTPTLWEIDYGQNGKVNPKDKSDVYGIEGEFYVGGKGFMGQDRDESIMDYNTPPATQPSLWAQWIINEDGELEWDGGEKFYSYIEWLKYYIDNFFEPWGVVANGEIKWQGEGTGDIGLIVVKNNLVSVFEGVHKTTQKIENDESILSLLKQLDDYAKSVDGYSLGLPIHGNYTQDLINIVKNNK